MADKVVDASALAAILFGEPEGDAIANKLENVRLSAPTLIEFELATICLLKCKRHPNQGQALMEAFRLRHEFEIKYIAVECDNALRLALKTGLTAYDASYLWLARVLDLELVTLDRQLMRAFSG